MGLNQSSLSPSRVLIVDDEDPVRKSVDRVLHEDGYDAFEVASGLESLEMLVTDMIMPRMTGYELARRLRQSNPSLKVLYLTGYADKLCQEKVALWQDEAFLDKPCGVKGLRQAVSLLLFGRLETTEATGS